MEEMVRTQLQHRTIRNFKAQALPNDDIGDLLNVANRTATSNGLQYSSLIRVEDEKIKAAISEVCKQEYVARAPELWIFIVDLYRNREIAREKGVETPYAASFERFFRGYTDAALAAQNVTNALEAKGYGAVYLGSILNDARKMIEILDMPHLTFPVLGLGFGIPDELPQQKPRMPKEIKYFTNQYRILPQYLEAISDYDEVMTHYYDLRDANRRSDNFSNQVVKNLDVNEPARVNVIQVIQDQGFLLEIEEEG